VPPKLGSACCYLNPADVPKGKQANGRKISQVAEGHTPPKTTFHRLAQEKRCYTPLHWKHEMEDQAPAPTVVRFGPFELLVETGELRKDGVRLKLSGQPIQVLIRLVATPGKLVTREELQHKLWAGNTYGDFEKGLNAAVNRLRENLEDSATDPKYIETVPGRGYRFIANSDTGLSNRASPMSNNRSRNTAGCGSLGLWPQLRQRLELTLGGSHRPPVHLSRACRNSPTMAATRS